jgi:hypothetical protein
MSSTNTPKQPAVEFNPLNLTYERFDESALGEYQVRTPVNHVYRKLQGIAAIARILEANEIEKTAQGKGLALDDVLAAGLFAALTELADGATDDVEDVGAFLAKKEGI